jgi:hypothetical protein
MSNLIKINQIDISNINIDNQTKRFFLSHTNNSKISEYKDKNEVSLKIDEIINYTFAYKGQTPSSQREYEFMSTAIKEDVFLKFYSYTIEDVENAFKLGVRGELGDYYGLNPKTFYSWLKDYKEKVLDPTISKVYKSLPAPQKTTPNQKEIDEYSKRLVCDVYMKLCKENVYEFNDIGNLIYNFLERIGLINFSSKEKNDIFNESKISLKNEVIKKNDDLKRLGKTFQKLDLEKAFSEIELGANKDFNNQLIVISKKIALKRFINDCKLSNVNLYELITNKLKNGN